MRILIAIVMLISSVYAGDCELTYQAFCQAGGKKYANMCPEKLTRKISCIATKEQSRDILYKCQRDLDSFCGDLKDFKAKYLCLSYPGHWEHMDAQCLTALSQGLH